MPTTAYPIIILKWCSLEATLSTENPLEIYAAQLLQLCKALHYANAILVQWQPLSSGSKAWLITQEWTSC